jgi:hypothetical protein
MLYVCSHKWLMLNFTRIFDSLIHDYHDEKYNVNAQNSYTLFEGKTEGLKTGKSGYKNQKVPLISFVDIESRYQNSVRYKNIWIEAFFIFSLVWSFGYILKPHMLKEFNRLIKRKIVGNKDELSTIAQIKNKLRNKHKKEYMIFTAAPNFQKLNRPPVFLLPFPEENTVFFF